jgi:hypothetical protein
VRERQNRVRRPMIMTDGCSSPVGVRGLNEATALPVTLKEARKALGRGMLERALKNPWQQSHRRRQGARHQPARPFTN